ncbi:GspH/FimT family pseudopilin [Massilia consociata]|uniref:Prepilin-type N-terminal cleavage/methylation domain-containing protein n=1 Tax=Massilia consociata TaxID=760117 RepID=A0ABV6FDX6_9BURK
MSGQMKKGRQGGFTMVELIIVIVLVGILSAFAASRFFDRRGFDAAAFADQTSALLRYAQKTAIARNAPVYVMLDDKRIALCYDAPRVDCAPVSLVPTPGNSIGGPSSDTHCRFGGWYCIARPEGVQLSRSVPMSAFSFDGLGRPATTGGSFDGLVLTIASAGESRTVSVTPETGYVR